MLVWPACLCVCLRLCLTGLITPSLLTDLTKQSVMPVYLRAAVSPAVIFWFMILLLATSKAEKGAGKKAAH